MGVISEAQRKSSATKTRRTDGSRFITLLLIKIPILVLFVFLFSIASVRVQNEGNQMDHGQGRRVLRASNSNLKNPTLTARADFYASLAEFKQDGTSRRNANVPSSKSKIETTNGSNQKQENALTLKHLLLPRIDKSVNKSWETEFQRLPLNFVHIPKTGGSSIVEAGIRAGLNWGDCLFQYQWPGRTCPFPPIPTGLPETDPLGRVWWHVPVQHLPTNSNPYHDMDLFAVVRNPYERAVSEVLYFCNLYGFCDGLWDPYDPVVAVELLNQKIQKAARKVHEKRLPQHYFFHDGHWIPQYDYFFNDKNDNPQRQERMIAHVLHTEHLQEEFASLMTAYGLEMVTLPEEKVKPRNDTVYLLGVPNLTLSTLQLLEHVYKDDFKLGGYPMISSILYPDTSQNLTFANIK